MRDCPLPLIIIATLFLYFASICIAESDTRTSKLNSNPMTLNILDFDNNPLPDDVLKKLYFKVEKMELNITSFRENFKTKMFDNLIIIYELFGRNWTLNYRSQISTDKDKVSIILDLKNVFAINTLLYNVTTEYKIIPFNTNISAIIHDPIFSSVSFSILFPDRNEIYINESYKFFYIPISNHENKSYDLYLRIYFYKTKIFESKLDRMSLGRQIQIPLLSVAKQLNLSQAFKIDRKCNIFITIVCGNVTLNSSARELIFTARERWIHPRDLSCEVRYKILDLGDEFTCHSTLTNLSRPCQPLYKLRLLVKNLEQTEKAEFRLNGTIISKIDDEICLRKGTYKLTVMYKISNLTLNILERKINIDSSLDYPIVFNLSDIRFYVKGNCSPIVFINGKEVTIEKLGERRYILRRFPRMPVNVTLKVCESIFSFNFTIHDDIQVEASTQPPLPLILGKTDGQFNIMPLLLTFIFVIVQIIVLLFVVIKQRSMGYA